MRSLRVPILLDQDQTILAYLLIHFIGPFLRFCLQIDKRETPQCELPAHIQLTSWESRYYLYIYIMSNSASDPFLLLVVARSQAFKLIYENWKPDDDVNSTGKAHLPSKNVVEPVENHGGAEQSVLNTMLDVRSKEYSDARARRLADREYVMLNYC
jgi:hypothetical protein